VVRLTLKSFLKTKDESLSIRIVYPMKIEDTKEELDYNIENKPHLFDVVNWTVEMNNYKPQVVVYVK
jgi:hypothetical protein